MCVRVCVCVCACVLLLNYLKYNFKKLNPHIFPYVFIVISWPHGYLLFNGLEMKLLCACFYLQ